MYGFDLSNPFIMNSSNSTNPFLRHFRWRHPTRCRACRRLMDEIAVGYGRLAAGEQGSLGKDAECASGDTEVYAVAEALRHKSAIVQKNQKKHLFFLIFLL
ncbi:MAG: hypothetical protein II707_05345 [Spirochaetales bacterium]|nr:hypothetical protein [Spirochaetales bacterium]